MQEISITGEGIQRNLKNYKPLDALCEYIWNGFDAQATRIDIVLHENEFQMVTSIDIIDNGLGIPYDELQYKFKPFNDSTKEKSGKRNNHTLPHGRKGIGRLTFFSFAQAAEWKTIFEKDGKLYGYSISIDRDALNQYDDNGGFPPEEVNGTPGTRVTFYQTNAFTKEEIENYVASIFFWFLELNQKRDFEICINGDPIKYDHYIEAKFTVDLGGLNLSHDFKAEIVHWNKSLGSEYSKFYFLDSNLVEKYKEATKLNKKSDEFYHSVFIQSNMFDDSVFDFETDENQLSFISNRQNPEYKTVMTEINRVLSQYRKNFLKEASDKYIEKLIDNQIYPSFDTNNFLDKYKKEELDCLVGTLYSAQPKIFTNLSDDNKKILIRLLNLIMETGNKDALFNVLKQIIDMNDEERAELEDVLKVTTLSNITRTIKLLEDRQRVIQGLKEIVFNKDFNAKEVPHLQTLVENHYWIFGEKYNLITAAEPDFEQALQGVLYKATGNKSKPHLDHPDKNKEMDIFMIRQNRVGEITENVVVELKRPSVSLGEEQLSQVKRYLSVIKSDDRFNAGNVKWTFYLVGNKFSKNGFIEAELENKRDTGDPHLVFSRDNNMTKIYVLKWSEIFEDYNKRHDFVMNRLKLQEDLWLQSHESPDAVVQELIEENSAKKDKAIVQKSGIL